MMDDIVMSLRGAMNRKPKPDAYLKQLLEDAAVTIERLLKREDDLLRQIQVINPLAR